MSYSIHAQAKTKEEAKAALATKFDEVVNGQPIHAKDREAALNAADDFLDTLGEPGDGQVVNVNLNGSLTWRGEGDEQTITGASVSVSASVIDAPAEEPNPAETTNP